VENLPSAGPGDKGKPVCKIKDRKNQMRKETGRLKK
jgi:hypothetical protein